MELSLQFADTHVHIHSRLVSRCRPGKGQEQVYSGSSPRQLSSRQGVHYGCFPIKNSFQKCSNKYFLALGMSKTYSKRRHYIQIQRSFYHNPCEFRFRQKKSRDMVARSELADAEYSDGLHRWSDIQLNSRIRGFLFYAVTACASILLIVPMLLQHPFVLLFDRYRRNAQYFIAKIWAFLTVVPFVKIEYKGLENLPSSDAPAVYVSNHQSFLDIYALLTIGRSFKFISKTSIFLYPIIGWAMFLLGVIPLKRMDTRSQMDCLKQCMSLINKGSSVFFFPEGTRSKDGKLGAFKKGAFSVAEKTGVPVVPITLIGTGKIMPSGEEGTVNQGSVKVIVHPPVAGTDAEALCNEARNAIAQELARAS